jgi:histidyl-tRNA synthetase
VSARLTAPRGTFDVLPEQAALRLRVEEATRELLESAGYGRIETPAFESTELFARGVGEATDIVEKEMYSFDDGGGRSLTLRPEGTAPVCRAYVEHGMHKLAAPVKLYYFESFFRAERPQAGRYRQFWQVGAEALGSEDPAVDAELIVLLDQLLGELGADGTRLRLSSLGTPATRAEYHEELSDYLRANADRLSETVRSRIDLNPLRAFDSDDASTQAVMASAPRLIDRLAPDDAEHFAQVCALLDATGVAYEIDPTLVRGLDYYARTVFEFTSEALGSQSGVGGGGRYDGLVELLGGPPTPGVGWAAGVERILMAGSADPSPPPPLDLYIAHEGARIQAFETAIEARKGGLRTELELAGRSLKGQLKHADRLGARFVAIIEPAGARLRDREGAGEVAVARERIVEEIVQALAR